jgi:Putative zinc-finger
MTGLSGCGDVRLALGVYVVGAIDPAERAIVDAHLSHCPACREELAGLAGVPALLGRVPARDVERLAEAGIGPDGLEEPPPELLSSLLRRVAARRRARKWRTITVAAAAAIIAVAGGLAGGAAISGKFSSGPAVAANHQSEQHQATDPLTHVSAVVAYSPAAWGTSLRVWVSGVRAGTTCEFWVVNAQGQRSIAGGWIVASGYKDQWYMVSSPVSEAKIRSFQVTAAGRVLVTVPA